MLTSRRAAGIIIPNETLTCIKQDKDKSFVIEIIKKIVISRRLKYWNEKYFTLTNKHFSKKNEKREFSKKN